MDEWKTKQDFRAVKLMNSSLYGIWFIKHFGPAI